MITIEELKKLKDNSGLSVRAFCREIGITNGDLYRILKGQKRINERIETNIRIYQEANKKGFFARLFGFLRGKK